LAYLGDLGAYYFIYCGGITLSVSNFLGYPIFIYSFLPSYFTAGYTEGCATLGGIGIFISCFL
jgi:hypothetical protein